MTSAHSRSSRTKHPLTQLRLKAIGIVFSVAGFSAQAAPLSLSEYLSQVKREHSGFRASQTQAEAGQLRRDEGDLQTAWTLVGNANLVKDYKLPQSPVGQYGSLWNHNYSVGFSKQWTFGLLTKLTYNLTGTTFVDPVNIPFGSFIVGPINYYNVYPMLEVSLPLLANGFGATVRAAQDLTEAGALASSYGARFMSKIVLTGAEATYWRLSVARSLLAIAGETLKRTEKLRDWNARRVQRQLADRSDLLQAEAGLQQARLAVQRSMDEVRSASRAFNAARNNDSADVPEELSQIHSDVIDKLAIPERGKLRDDVKAAEQQMRIAKANAVIAREKDLPALDIFGSLALNGQPAGATWPTSFTDSINNTGFARPTYAAGARLSVPLYFVTMHHAREGWSKESISAELNYERKLYDQEQAWLELTQRFSESKHRLEITRNLEKIQGEKVQNERLRYERGRTVTFQLLSFENEYLNSQIQRLSNELELISTVSQMKTFMEEVQSEGPNAGSNR